MKKKILILGGGGFIGANLASYISARYDCNLTLADYRFGRDMASYVDVDKTKFITADFTLPNSFSLLETDYDHVYMLASIVGVNNTIERPDSVIRVNSKLILNTLDWLDSSSVSKVLFSSTSETYSATTELFNHPIPTAEDVPVSISDTKDPRFSYAVTKILGESGFLNAAKGSGYRATIVRYHNAFGPDMGFKHVIPHLVERFASGEKPFRVYGHDQTRAFSYISDTVRGTLMAMESEEADGEVIHIGTDVEISIEQLVKEVGKLMGYRGEYVPAETYPGSVNRRCPDIGKARRLLGYEPEVDWRSGLATTVKWYEAFFHENLKPTSDGFIPRENFN